MTPAGAPTRPDLASARRGAAARWWPAAAVLGVVLVVTVGAQVVERALVGGAEPTVAIGGVLAMEPAPGWREEPRLRVDDGALHRRVVVRGAAALAIQVIEGVGGTPDALAARYADPELRARFVQLRVSRVEPVLVAGVPGVRFGYLGVTRDRATVEGVVTAIVAASGTAVVFEAFAPEGGLAGVAGQLGAMIDGAAVR